MIVEDGKLYGRLMTFPSIFFRGPGFSSSPDYDASAPSYPHTVGKDGTRVFNDEDVYKQIEYEDAEEVKQRSKRRNLDRFINPVVPSDHGVRSVVSELRIESKNESPEASKKKKGKKKAIAKKEVKS